MSMDEKTTSAAQGAEAARKGPIPPDAPAEAPGAKPRRKESKELKGLLKAERAASKAASKLSRAVARGVEEYRRRSEKSARKRKDGAVADLARNVASSVGEAVRGASEVPAQLTRAIDPKTVRRAIKALRSPFRR